MASEASAIGHQKEAEREVLKRGCCDVKSNEGSKASNVLVVQPEESFGLVEKVDRLETQMKDFVREQREELMRFQEEQRRSLSTILELLKKK